MSVGSKPRVGRSAPEKKQQKLLATEAARLKAASADIQLLKDQVSSTFSSLHSLPLSHSSVLCFQVENLKLAMAKRSSDHQQRARDTKRMQQLEQHVS